MDRQLDGLTGRRQVEPAARKGQRKGEDFPVLEPLVPVAMLFWRSTAVMVRPGMGGPPYALDWVQVETIARNTGVPLPLGEWVVDVLDAMAHAACKILREQAEKQNKD